MGVSVVQLFFGLLVLVPGLVQGQPADLFACAEDGELCAETEVAVVDSSCGRNFYYYKGRVAWLLRNDGPITISLWTRAGQFTRWPLYLEVAGFPVGYEDSVCVTYLPGRVVFAAQGVGQCEGAWETFGPLDLANLGIAIGSPYVVQLEGFESPPDLITGGLYHSTDFACIRVSSASSTMKAIDWGRVKALYR